MSAAVMTLLAFYYIYGLEYPKCFAMVPAVLQTLVIGEMYQCDTSKKYKFFMKRLKVKFDKAKNSQTVSED